MQRGVLSLILIILVGCARQAGLAPVQPVSGGASLSGKPAARPIDGSEDQDNPQQLGNPDLQGRPEEEAGLQTPVAGSTSATRPAEEAAAAAPLATSNPARSPLARDAWKELPVVPSTSETARQIYERGLTLGNQPHVFSKVGDCQNVASMFLAFYDDSPKYYSLGKYAYLKETIDWFSGSFARESLAVKGGFNGAALMSPLRADPKRCQKGESPLACELRDNRPSFVILSLETWWSKKPAEVYEKYMRQVIEYTLAQGGVPILATKADNLEGDESINATIAKLAYEYDLPLWNFWRAVQPLPNHGLSADGFHLTFAGNFFDDSEKMQSAWPVRNLTALQALDAVWRGVTGRPPAAP